MSKAISETWVCDSCGKEQVCKVWASINTQLDPELKLKLIDGTLNFFNCQNQNCWDTKRFVDILYHDMDKGLMIWLMQNYSSQNSINELANSLVNFCDLNQKRILRIVKTRTELIEKIMITDDGLDDRVIEVLKSVFVQQNKIDSGLECNLLYTGKSDHPQEGIVLTFNGSLPVMFNRPNPITVAPIRISIYNKINEILTQVAGPSDKGSWLEINSNYARPVANILVKNDWVFGEACG